MKIFATLVFVFVIIIFPLQSHAAYVWTERQPGGDLDLGWRSIASDSDGTNLIAAVTTGRLYTSTDSGANWTERQPGGDLDLNWRSVASDSDGSNLVAAVSTGRLYTSADSGANWTERQPGGDLDLAWRSVASDSDGTNLIAAVLEGRLYTSADSGANWTERQPLGDLDAFWTSVDSDDDGSNLIATDGVRLYTSADSGANWTERQPAGDNDLDWASVASDHDGSNLIAASNGGFAARVYISSDSGANWTETQPIGDMDGNWGTVASDADGSTLAATNQARVYVSTDGGGVWAEEQPGGNTDLAWSTLSLIADGSQIAAAVDNGRIYTGALDSTNPTLDSFSPLDEAQDVALGDNLILNFSEVVEVQSGNIVIKKSADDSTFESIAVGSGNVTGSGTATITVNPTASLEYSTSYYVNIDATAFDDIAGNGYAGINNSTTWNFSTEADPTPAPSTTSGSSAKRNKAEKADMTPACREGDNFNFITGKPCVTFVANPITPNAPAPACLITLTLRQGSTGEQVKCLQNKLNTETDGIFGPITESAVKNYQTLKNLIVDGIVGPQTRAALNK